MSDERSESGSQEGRIGVEDLVDAMEELFVRRDEFDALRAQVEELRRLVEAKSEERPQP
ncbi:MAG: hypothetical protein M3N25_03065 [Actinomycetota bacterium]|nr:hypothetical protein [Actinomycetota bacterium]